MKPKNQLEEGGRTSAPVQRDSGEPEKKCPNCHRDIPLSRLWANDLVCPCGYHFRMKARQRIQMITDRGSFRELFSDMRAENPLNFPGYNDKIETVRAQDRDRPRGELRKRSRDLRVRSDRQAEVLSVCYGALLHDGQHGQRRRRKNHFPV